MDTIKKDDLILICYRDKKYLKKAETNRTFNGKGGTILFSELIGNMYGTRFGEYEIYKPTIEDIIMFGIKRETQIIYPKDAAFICLKLDLKNSFRVLEVGTGSGALTCIFSKAVGSDGFVVSLEKEHRHYRNAKKNIERFTEFKNVELINGDVSDYSGTDFDAAFIDVREPWLYIDFAHRLMKASGTIGMIVPTTNQISELLKTLDEHKGFGDVEVLEILMRRYKTVSERVRPFDRMVAHTGYLVFARKLVKRSD